MLLSTIFLIPSLAGLTAVSAASFGRSTQKATLSFSTRIDQDGELSVVEKDHARARALENAGHEKRSGVFSHIIANSAITYTAQVGIGDPAVWYTLLIESGSPNTWIGPSKPYSPSSNSNDTEKVVSLTYNNVGFSARVWTDSVTLCPGLVVNNQPIGVASTAPSMSGINGILGLGLIDLTNSNTSHIIMDNLVAQKQISQKIFAIYYTPASASRHGEITFGGYDDSVVTSEVNYAPLTQTSPASQFWGIDQSISYGDAIILPTTVGVVDTGSTFISLATDAYNSYQGLTKSVRDEATHLLTITASQYSSLQTLSFNIGGQTYDLSPNAQVWPASLNSAIGGSAKTIYLVVVDLGRHSGAGLDFILGYVFLERFYTVFDGENGQVGFATTAYTDATTN